jgi:hypothetical protein
MTVPEKINASWIATLTDKQLIRAESQLHTEFLTQETAEKRRRGDRYTMLRGPESLVSAWHRWLMVNNETRNRGVVVHRKQGGNGAAGAARRAAE